MRAIYGPSGHWVGRIGGNATSRLTAVDGWQSGWADGTPSLDRLSITQKLLYRLSMKGCGNRLRQFYGLQHLTYPHLSPLGRLRQRQGEGPEILSDSGRILHQSVNKPLLSPPGRLRQKQGEVPQGVRFAHLNDIQNPLLTRLGATYAERIAPLGGQVRPRGAIAMVFDGEQNQVFPIPLSHLAGIEPASVLGPMLLEGVD
jgi:hypothetical protein